MDNVTYAAAVAYFHGRANGNEEDCHAEMKRLNLNPHTMAVKAAYDRGVADYCALDLPDEEVLDRDEFIRHLQEHEGLDD